ncbi:uncharacterized protein LOC117061134 [Lacerta agilis]|uniref:uncharacterized protein LOC117061134 n=1 Tax=Lacerta agilis TaxID=80427 RepID=UPI00141964A6|nr:uncharacterized protein LOC117061134 [Lacerta agilis]
MLGFSVVLCIAYFCPSFGVLVSPDPELLSQGRTRLQQARELARHPRYGTCWMGALGQLDAGCRELDEEQQSRIAIAFAHCHLQRSGRKFPPCEPSSSIRGCTQDMDPVAFGVYTEFFTHAQSICYFLHNEAWQQQAQDTMHRLTSSSETVARQLESTHQLAGEIAQAQDATLRSQEQILQDGELLHQILRDSSQGVRQAFQELQDSAVEQRVAFAEIFNRVAFLHRFVIGESSALYSVFFHLLSGAASLVLTSSQLTARARFPLLILVGANIYLERVICSLLMDEVDGGHDLTERISFWVGLSRRGFACLGFAVVTYFIWIYKDPAKQSQEVLQSLQETRTEIQRLLQETERLLAEPELLLLDSEVNAEKKEFTDSGFPKLLPCSQHRTATQVKERRADQQKMEETWTSSPKRRGRSPSRTRRSPSRTRRSPSRTRRSPSRTRRSRSRQRNRTRNVTAQPLAIPVPLEQALQRSLQSHRSLEVPRPPIHH